MDFKIPLYHLDKYQSGGVYHRRIKHIKIEIKGTESTVDPWRGRLIHSGSFLLRDKVSTLAPDTTRLIPTREELDALYANTQIGKGQGKAVKGVIPIILDEDRFEFTTDTSSVGEDGGQEVNALFEGYGAAALWRLELDNDDLRKLSDITLTFNFDIPESNSDLQRKIRTLLKAYEQELTDGEALDQILVLSMGQLFPNEFDGLQSGQSIFNLNEEVIPSTYANLEFKAVACQALDQEGKGVAGVRIEISKSGTTFSRQMTTDSAGLSDQAGSDLDVLEREQRFPLLGDWQIRLPDAADYNKFKSGNLVLFFVYSYRAKDQEN